MILVMILAVVRCQHWHRPRPPQFMEHCVFEHVNCTGSIIYKDSRRIDNCLTAEDAGCFQGHKYQCVTDLETPMSMENYIAYKYSTYADTCMDNGYQNWIDHIIGFKNGCYPLRTGESEESHGSVKYECESGHQKITYYMSKDCTTMIVHTDYLAWETEFDTCRPSINGMWQVVHCQGQE